MSDVPPPLFGRPVPWPPEGGARLRTGPPIIPGEAGPELVMTTNAVVQPHANVYVSPGEEPTMNLTETCSTCKGRGFHLPSGYPPEHYRERKKPPRTEWCKRCDRTGEVLTAEGRALLSFLARYKVA